MSLIILSFYLFIIFVFYMVSYVLLKSSNNIILQTINKIFLVIGIILFIVYLNYYISYRFLLVKYDNYKKNN